MPAPSPPASASPTIPSRPQSAAAAASANGSGRKITSRAACAGELISASGREEGRHEEHRQHGEGSAENVSSRPAPACEHRRRDAEERGDRRRTASGDGGRREAEPTPTLVERRPLCGQIPRRLGSGREERRSVEHDRPEPGEEQRDGNENGGDAHREPAPVAAGRVAEQESPEKESRERKRDEDGVGRIDGRETERRGGDRQQP